MMLKKILIILFFSAFFEQIVFAFDPCRPFFGVGSDSPTVVRMRASKVPLETVIENAHVADASARAKNVEQSITKKSLTLTQKKALELAHQVGQNEPGLDPNYASGVFNYTNRQLAKKMQILQEGGFSKAESKKILEEGHAGFLENLVELSREASGINAAQRLMQGEKNIFDIYRDVNLLTGNYSNALYAQALKEASHGNMQGAMANYLGSRLMDQVMAGGKKVESMTSAEATVYQKYVENPNVIPTKKRAFSRLYEDYSATDYMQYISHTVDDNKLRAFLVNKGHGREEVIKGRVLESENESFVIETDAGKVKVKIKDIKEYTTESIENKSREFTRTYEDFRPSSEVRYMTSLYSDGAEHAFLINRENGRQEIIVGKIIEKTDSDTILVQTEAGKVSIELDDIKSYTDRSLTNKNAEFLRTYNNLQTSTEVRYMTSLYSDGAHHAFLVNRPQSKQEILVGKIVEKKTDEIVLEAKDGARSTIKLTDIEAYTDKSVDNKGEEFNNLYKNFMVSHPHKYMEHVFTDEAPHAFLINRREGKQEILLGKVEQKISQSEDDTSLVIVSSNGKETIKLKDVEMFTERSTENKSAEFREKFQDFDVSGKPDYLNYEGEQAYLVNRKNGQQEIIQGKTLKGDANQIKVLTKNGEVIIAKSDVEAYTYRNILTKDREFGRIFQYFDIKKFEAKEKASLMVGKLDGFRLDQADRGFLVNHENGRQEIIKGQVVEVNPPRLISFHENGQLVKGNDDHLAQSFKVQTSEGVVEIKTSTLAAYTKEHLPTNKPYVVQESPKVVATPENSTRIDYKDLFNYELPKKKVEAHDYARVADDSYYQFQTSKVLTSREKDLKSATDKYAPHYIDYIYKSKGIEGSDFYGKVKGFIMFDNKNLKTVGDWSFADRHYLPDTAILIRKKDGTTVYIENPIFLSTLPVDDRGIFFSNRKNETTMVEVKSNDQRVQFDPQVDEFQIFRIGTSE
jgi:hypothetical protein